MGRRKDESVFDDIHEIFKYTPIWSGPASAVAAFVTLRYIVPALFPSPSKGGADLGSIVGPWLPLLSWMLAAAIVMAWFAAEIWKLSNRKLLDRQCGIESIGNLSWREFERLVCEAYRRRGYAAAVVGSSTGDGGIDIILTRAGEKVLVQCKHWKAMKVGVSPVREMLGVVVSERATSGILVTSGRFTDEAERFAAANPQLKLVAGAELAQMIEGVRSAGPVSSMTAAPDSPIAESACPACGSRMVLRTAQKGPNAGSQFWGCSTYPRCRGSRPVAG